MPRSIFLWSTALLLSVELGPPAFAARGFDWRLSPAASDAEGLRAVSAGPAAALAWGGDRGFTVETGGRRRRFATRGAVRDLAFDARGTLWIATDAGLWRIDSGGRFPISDGPGAGERARATQRIATAGSFLAVATTAGVYWRRGEEEWAPVAGALRSLAVGGLALSAAAATGETATLWMSSERGLFAANLSAIHERVVARSVPLPARPRPLFDVAVWDGWLWVIAERRLLGAELPAAAQSPELDSTAWESHPLTLPPGALPQRLAVAAHAAFTATDRGLLIAASPRGPWRRAAAPAGGLSVADVAVISERVFLATRRGLVVGEARPESIAPTDDAQPLCEPSIGSVQRAVLAYLNLAGDPLARQRRRVRQRGYLPEVRLEGVYESASDRNSRRDQSFVSGATRRLFDSDHQSDRDRKVALVLSWELGDVAYNPEEIDISAETRRLVELRDDVLDEVNQLYFDRQRALQAGEALRAGELAAGLDAWTGGWFGAHFEPCAGH